MQDALDEQPVHEPFSGAFDRHDDDLRIEPIPASLHPDMELASVMDESVAKPGFFADINWGALGRMVGGFACGVALVAAAAYGFTMSAQPPIVVQDVKAEIFKGSDVIHVSGKIANKSDHAMELPDLGIVPLAEDGSEGEGQRLDLGQAVLDAGADTPFESKISVASDVSAQVRLRFHP